MKELLENCGGRSLVRPRKEKTCFDFLNYLFARVIFALFFPILAAEKSGFVKYADFLCGGLDLGFILL